MMFSSGKHARLTDATPWLRPDGLRGATSNEAFWEVGEDIPFTPPIYAPRPEFDRPLTNTENPILRFFRAEVERYGDPAHGDYMRWLEPYARSQGRLILYGKPVIDTHADHARRVLILLDKMRTDTVA